VSRAFFFPLFSITGRTQRFAQPRLLDQHARFQVSVAALQMFGEGTDVDLVVSLSSDGEFSAERQGVHLGRCGGFTRCVFEMDSR
jgi:hypothetical protein